MLCVACACGRLGYEPVAELEPDDIVSIAAPSTVRLGRATKVVVIAGCRSPKIERD